LEAFKSSLYYVICRIAGSI